MAATLLRALCVMAFVGAGSASHIAASSGVMRMRGGFGFGGYSTVDGYENPQEPDGILRRVYKQRLGRLTERQIRQLPWYILLEESHLKLGEGPVGMPHSGHVPSVADTLFERDPKLAFGISLYTAAKLGIMKGLDKLLKLGVSPNFLNPRTNYNALQIAAINGNTDICERLIKAGADPHFKGNTGKTPAEIARFWGHDDTGRAIEMLAAAGTSAMQEGKDGKKEQVFKLFP